MTEIDPEILSMIQSGGYRLMPTKDIDEALRYMDEVKADLEREADFNAGEPNREMVMLSALENAIAWLRFGRPYE